MFYIRILNVRLGSSTHVDVHVQVSKLSACVPRATDSELSEWVTALANAVEIVCRPATPAESALLPASPSCIREYFAYQELNTQRTVRAFRSMPDFRELPIALQTSVLKVLLQIQTINALLCSASPLTLRVECNSVRVNSRSSVQYSLERTLRNVRIRVVIISERGVVSLVASES